MKASLQIASLASDHDSALYLHSQPLERSVRQNKQWPTKLLNIEQIFAILKCKLYIGAAEKDEPGSKHKPWHLQSRNLHCQSPAILWTCLVKRVQVFPFQINIRVKEGIPSISKGCASQGWAGKSQYTHRIERMRTPNLYMYHRYGVKID